MHNLDMSAWTHEPSGVFVCLPHELNLSSLNPEWCDPARWLISVFVEREYRRQYIRNKNKPATTNSRRRCKVSSVTCRLSSTLLRRLMGRDSTRIIEALVDTGIIDRGSNYAVGVVGSKGECKEHKLLIPYGETVMVELGRTQSRRIRRNANSAFWMWTNKE